MRDLHNEVKVSKALATTAISSDTNTDGEVIDMAGYKSCEFVILSATLTDGTYTPAVLESDASDMSGATAAAAADLLGTVAGATFAAANDGAVKKLGYRGSKRYVKLRVTSASTTSGGTVSAVCIQSEPAYAPVS
jgi:hypothetical protein